MSLLFRNFWNTLRRYRMASILNIMGLGVAFAAFAIIMMQVRYDLTYDHSQREHERIYRLENANWREGDWSSGVPRPFVELIADEFPEVEAIAGYGASYSLESVPRFRAASSKSLDYPFEIEFLEVGPAFTQVFDFDWAAGDGSQLGEPNTVLLPLSMAERLFPAGQAVGQYIEQEPDRSPMRRMMKEWDGVDSTASAQLRVVGIYRDFPANATLKNHLYRRIDPAGVDEKYKWNQSREAAYLRLRADADTTGIAERLTTRFREASGFEEARPWRLTALYDTHLVTDLSFDSEEKIDLKRTHLFMMIAILIVVIALINFNNFSNALVPTRLRAINTQKVFGCSIGAIRGMMLFEAVGICLIAAALAIWLVAALAQSGVADLMIAPISWGANLPLLFGVIGTALVAGLLAGLYPAFYISSFPTALALKGSFGLTPRGKRVRQLLISFQYVISIGLIIVATFVHVQSSYMKKQPMGFDRAHLLELQLEYSFPVDRCQALREAWLQLPGVEDAGFVSNIQLVSNATTGRTSYGFDWNDETANLMIRHVSIDLLRTIGVRVIEGRDFTPADVTREKYVGLIINRTAQERYGIEPGESSGRWLEFVGVVEDINFAPLSQAVEPMGFEVLEDQNPFFRYAYIRIAPASDPRTVIAAIERTAREREMIGEENRAEFIDRSIARLYEKEDKLALLVTLFSLVAIVISLIGIFGLVLFEGRFRRKEIGIRKVHGATIAEVLALLNRGFVRIVLACFVIASPIAWYAIRQWRSDFAYQAPIPWWIFAVALLIVLVITLLTVTLQSYRTATENPIESIKTE